MYVSPSKVVCASRPSVISGNDDVSDLTPESVPIASTRGDRADPELIATVSTQVTPDPTLKERLCLVCLVLLGVFCWV